MNLQVLDPVLVGGKRHAFWGILRMWGKIVTLHYEIEHHTDALKGFDYIMAFVWVALHVGGDL